MKARTTRNTIELRDGISLESAKYIPSYGGDGHKIPVYDDGWGPLWIHRDTMGISGIVRAQSWEDAYSICEDEFFPEAGETIEELQREYNFKRETVKIIRTRDGDEREDVYSDYPFSETGVKFVRWETRETPSEDENGWTENCLFMESYGFRPNGARSGKCENGEDRDPIGHGIYAKDLNGDALDRLTPRLARELGIVLYFREGTRDDSRKVRELVFAGK